MSFGRTWEELIDNKIFENRVAAVLLFSEMKKIDAKIQWFWEWRENTPKIVSYDIFSSLNVFIFSSVHIHMLCPMMSHHIVAEITKPHICGMLGRLKHIMRYTAHQNLYSV